MVTVPGVLRRSSTVNFVENGGSSGESSRRPSLADSPPSRRTSLAGLSLRLSSRSKRTGSGSVKEMQAMAEKAAQKLGQAFFSLPDEIIIQILCYLGQSDVFALRLTSHSMNTFLNVHACPITRSVLTQCARDRAADDTAEDEVVERKAEYAYNYIQTLYPQPTPCPSTDYMLQMLRRQAQIDKMLSVTMSFVQMRVYMMPSSPRFSDFRPYKNKLTRRMHLAAWTIYHFLERYRDLLIHAHPRHEKLEEHNHPSMSPAEEPALPSLSSCPQCNESLKALLRSYPGTEVIPAYHFYDLCRQHLRALSRAPTYAGTIERRLRGWSRKSPTEADLATFVIFGGIAELSKLSMLKGSYTQRIDVIGSFTDKITLAVSSSGSLDFKPSSPSAYAQSASTSSDMLPGAPNSAFKSISQDSLSAVPVFERFISASDEWITRMFEVVRPGDQLVTAFGFVQNVLAGKQEPPPGLGRISGSEADSQFESPSESGSHGGVNEDRSSDLDFLAPVKAFD
ncbi:hypothetical protein PV08_08065 [Exophiala spinifera]|uniref:F-box domain-containing protein n=1 Tax=Exophiala spinifera TaxID=91928 RepID=A0A0D2B1T0_9EURO|nr:uncharacterized protein PV08_08065 [Exophiala spinifera]KIW12878.1 hypothetical protein PV08_08065 [Exophiala spinifera]